VIRIEEQLADHVFDVVHAVARRALDDSAARLIRWPREPTGDLPAGVDLEPTSDRAARLTIAVDKPGQAYIDVGRHGTHFEVWEKAGEGFDRAISSIVDAVMRGAYEEWVKLGRDDRLVAAKGVFHELDGGPRTVRHNALGLFADRRPGWTHVREHADPRRSL
jgi:hypothetical protein